ncbi:MAG: hypothetical protein J5654_09275 [Victivallales bacterium]|nr:hypothetical protein [Victivallales bacterium]
MSANTFAKKALALASALLLSASCQDLAVLMTADTTEAAKPIVNPKTLSQEEKLAQDVEAAPFRKAWLDLGKVADEYKDVLGGEDKSLFHRRSKGLLRDAFEVVASDTGLKAYDEIRALQAEQTKLSDEANDLKANRWGYPDSSKNPFAMTRDKCDKRLKEIDERNMQINARINAQTGVLLNDLNRYGKIIDRKYLDYLLVSAEGEDVFQLLNTATLLKQVQYAIRRQMEEGGGNAAQVEHYVGLYLVILKGWEQAHQVGLENIEKKFLPKLAEIQKEAEQNTRDTRELLKTHADEASHLEANLRISQNTIEVSKAYNEILVRKQQDLKESLGRLKSKIEVAQNTYRTVKTASGLLKLINDSSQEYEAILNFDPPLLDTIYADQMLDAFKEVSAQLKK